MSALEIVELVNSGESVVLDFAQWRTFCNEIEEQVRFFNCNVKIDTYDVTLSPKGDG